MTFIALFFLLVVDVGLWVFADIHRGPLIYFISAAFVIVFLFRANREIKLEKISLFFLAILYIPGSNLIHFYLGGNFSVIVFIVEILVATISVGFLKLIFGRLNAE